MLAAVLKIFGLPGSIALAAALVLLAGVGVQSWRLDSAQDQVAAFKLEKAEAETAAAAAKLAHSEELRSIEKTYADNLLGIAEQLQKEENDASAEVDRLLAGLAAGTQRLHARFSCPPAGNGAPGNPAAAGADQAGGAGLLPADADFLVRESKRADDAARDLNACIAAYNQVREANNAP